MSHRSLGENGTAHLDPRSPPTPEEESRGEADLAEEELEEHGHRDQGPLPVGGPVSPVVQDRVEDDPEARDHKEQAESEDPAPGNRSVREQPKEETPDEERKHQLDPDGTPPGPGKEQGHDGDKKEDGGSQALHPGKIYHDHLLESTAAHPPRNPAIDSRGRG